MGRAGGAPYMRAASANGCRDRTAPRQAGEVDDSNARSRRDGVIHLNYTAVIICIVVAVDTGQLSSVEADTRQCVVCGTPLTRHRKDARYCGPPCRAEANRLKAILSASGQYSSISERLERRRG